MEPKIWLSSPHMSGFERQYIDEAFNSNWIAPLGPNVTGFEQSLESYLGEGVHVAALSSGTGAIHLALIMLGVTAGDEVICQSKTFSASANPIVYQGAIPVFVDSEPESWNISPELLEEAIRDRINKGKKPKAIVAVHLYGMPYMVNEVNDIASRYDIPVIEDSAESLGSTYNGRKCGTFGDLSILSFNGNKIITTSGGGALVAHSEELKNKAVFLSTQARDKSPAYLHSQIGYNYRMSNVVAGIGRGQMEVLDSYVSKRRANHELYRQELPEGEFSFLDEPDGHFSNRWLSCVLTNSIETREGVRLLLESHNIECRPLWKPMHQQPVFENAPKYLNGVSDELFEKGLCLPSGSNLTENELNRVITTIKSYFD
ncbi:MAG: aminotransferase class I/II-fold pyridoxal phosphate-dependent enzyme [Bacteroidia bacterium]|nr:aminotransferase class I/II-fold pyridoxal phosphate-dependent enzyme [Bacteroidia bacterium]MBT8268669.1 aminotransferase class I/II-fold pyridoxal phosphate-dependent enzyme [Bacteroidia bacterium]NNF82281.1 aminotransferase class I/II-fold pyridoxal phosphate-dependent enzyme [Flavobacteriaceae bacterium]NNK69816.1 aminotransferase class I/II-fold pyridoxal phosphate-dependent enzyme [Flavobacteriaceae bacterium]NNL81480.1 aminotransferase class I/II-fold pyridoxal phosphate-dependent enz